MMRRSLALTDNTTPPAFRTADEAVQWLSRWLGSDPVQSQSMLFRQVGLMNRCTMPPTDRLRILEALWPHCLRIQHQMRPRYTDKALPLLPPELNALDSTVTAWRELLRAYLICLDALHGGDPMPADAGARIVERALGICVEWRMERVLGRHECEKALWEKAHRIVQMAETLATRSDAGDPRIEASAHAAYGRLALLHLAALHELPVGDSLDVAAWCAQLGAALEVSRTPPVAREARAMPIFVDLDSAQPAGHISRPVENGRWLDTRRIRGRLKHAIDALRRGEESIGLEGHRDQPSTLTEKQLSRVYERWCKGGRIRHHSRLPAHWTCEVAWGIDAATLCVAQATRGASPTPVLPAAINPRTWQVSGQWNVMDSSVSGLRLHRDDAEGQRIHGGELIAVRPAGTEGIVLGSCRWVLQHGKQALSCGIELFPGHATVHRACPVGAPDTCRQDVLLLPPLEALDTCPSLIAPPNRFREHQLLKVSSSTEAQWLIQVDAPMERSAGFDRFAFVGDMD